MKNFERSDNELSFVGDKSVYEAQGKRPFATGRASLLWIAKDKKSERIVCIKEFREDDIHKGKLSEFFKEISARQFLHHPNIIPILDFGLGAKNSFGPFIVLPYCEGGNLRSFMLGKDFLSLNVFLPIIEQISAAIDFAHSNGVIHGDIKPENILFLDKDKTHVCLTDFGIAVVIPISEDITTAGGRGAGSTAYLSPEQIEHGKQTPLSDLYALAMVAYEALTGQLPFNTSAPPFAQMHDKVIGRIINPKEINPQLNINACNALIKGLSVKPLDRPTSAKEFCQLLRGDKIENSIPIKRRSSFWQSLKPSQKAAIITGIITTIGVIVAALIGIIPTLLK